jgi:hypothetical protein
MSTVYSFIQHRWYGIFGIALWANNGKLVIKLIDKARNDVLDGERQMMAARALVNRLKYENPQSIHAIRIFSAKEGNEMGISNPQLVNEKYTSAETLAQCLLNINTKR